MKNIVLVGFMGTGKTTIAKILSGKLGMKYISTDDMIKAGEKSSIADIFSKKGESYFRKIEKEAIRYVSGMDGVVVDAGGGVVIDAENIENLKKKGLLVCLSAAPEPVLERTKAYSHRPLLEGADPLSKIKELMESRKQFYKRADFCVDTGGKSPTEVSSEIERIINEATTYGTK